MALTKEEVRYIARLARLEFTEEEVERLTEEMGTIVEYMDKLSELDTAGVPPMAHAFDLHSVDREDVAEQRITREEALKNAPETDGTYVHVPKVIE